MSCDKWPTQRNRWLYSLYTRAYRIVFIFRFHCCRPHAHTHTHTHRQASRQENKHINIIIIKIQSLSQLAMMMDYARQLTLSLPPSPCFTFSCSISHSLSLSFSLLSLSSSLSPFVLLLSHCEILWLIHCAPDENVNVVANHFVNPSQCGLVDLLSFSPSLPLSLSVQLHIFLLCLFHESRAQVENRKQLSTAFHRPRVPWWIAKL